MCWKLGDARLASATLACDREARALEELSEGGIELEIAEVASSTRDSPWIERAREPSRSKMGIVPESLGAPADRSGTGQTTGVMRRSEASGRSSACSASVNPSTLCAYSNRVC